jgi:hypothetical protein
MAVINPFPEEAIRQFLADAEARTRYLFALSNAQRTVTMADVAVGGLDEIDREIIDSTLESCWAAAGGTPDGGLREYIEPLFSRMVPDDEDEYSPYNSAVNSALASLAYAIESSAGDGTAESAHFAASSMFDLADYLLHRNRSGGYVDDLAAAPITALAAQSVIVDMDRLAHGTTPRDLRQRVIDEGHQIASLAS